MKGRPHEDPFSTPIVSLELRQTFRRLTAGSVVDDSAAEATLTDRGRRNRLRRNRRGQTTSRVDDAADEEAAI